MKIKDYQNLQKGKLLAEIDPAKLQKQFVPPDRNLWEIENYEDFLQHRGRMVIEKINEYL